MAGLRALLENGFRVRIGTTQTPANKDHLAALCQFHLRLGIPESDHFVRELAWRGFSHEGLEVNRQNLSPEITVDESGVYWHPLTTDADMLVSQQIFPLAGAVCQVQGQLDQAGANGKQTFK